MSRMGASHLPSMSPARAALPSLTKGRVKQVCDFMREIVGFHGSPKFGGAPKTSKMKTYFFANI